MFDLGFSELVVIAIVLLVVVGPERLPGVARTVGHLFGRAQRYVAGVKADIQREIQLDDLKKLQQQTQALDRSLREEMGEIQSSMRAALDFSENAVAGEPSPPESAAPAELENVDADVPEAQLRLDLDQETAPVEPAVQADKA